MGAGHGGQDEFTWYGSDCPEHGFTYLQSHWCPCENVTPLYERVGGGPAPVEPGEVLKTVVRQRDQMLARLSEALDNTLVPLADLRYVVLAGVRAQHPDWDESAVVFEADHRLVEAGVRRLTEEYEAAVERCAAESGAWMNGVADVVEPYGYDREAACGPADLLPGLQQLVEERDRLRAVADAARRCGVRCIAGSYHGDPSRPRMRRLDCGEDDCQNPDHFRWVECTDPSHDLHDALMALDVSAGATDG